jgi:hypothetical protein
MKKLKKHQHKQSRAIKSASTFNPIMGLLVVFITALVGVYILKASFATGFPLIITTRFNTNHSAAGGVHVTLTTQLGGCDEQLDFATDSSGSYTLHNCTPQPSKFCLSSATLGGYVIAGVQTLSQTGDGSYSAGMCTSLSAAAGEGRIIVDLARDTDGDTVYDSIDTCPSQPGPASNRGCPVLPPPAPKPPASSTKKTPATPPPTPPPAPAIVKSTSGDTTPPSAPLNLTSKYSNGAVSLSWDAATDNLGVAAYSIERSTGSSDWVSVAASVKGTSYEDTVAGPDATYSYRVRAVDAAGNQSEATYADVAVETNSTGTNTASEQQTKAPVKKSHAGKTALKIGGLVLVLAALVGGVVMFLKWRAARALEVDDQIRETAVENAIHTVEPIAPHEAQSLKDMILHDTPPNHPKSPKSKN